MPIDCQAAGWSAEAEAQRLDSENGQSMQAGCRLLCIQAHEHECNARLSPAGGGASKGL